MCDAGELTSPLTSSFLRYVIYFGGCLFRSLFPFILSRREMICKMNLMYAIIIYINIYTHT